MFLRNFKIVLILLGFSSLPMGKGLLSGKIWAQEISDFSVNSTEKVLPEFYGIMLAQASTGAQSSSTLTNSVYFISTNTDPTIWERYYSTTSVHPLRRADVLFFISIPFTILWTDFWVQRFRDFSVIGAFSEGVRGTKNLQNLNFTYYHDTYPSTVGDPYYIFKWVNAVLWPLVIVGNDFLERISDPVKWEKEKEEMIDNRFHLNLIYLPSH